jgi:hypothetical protein
MTRVLTVTWLTLLLLTAATGLLLLSAVSAWNGPKLILILSGLKFLLVSWFFLGLRKAHAAWKFLIMTFIVVLFIVLGLSS